MQKEYINFEKADDEDPVIKYMVERDWEKDKLHRQKIEALSVIKDISHDSDILKKIGAVLLIQQIYEQLLKEILTASFAYIKAELWPTEVDFKLNWDNKTLGALINLFNDNSIKLKYKSMLHKLLLDHNNIRNKIVHNLFLKESLSDVNPQIDRILFEFPDVIAMLLDYYDDICFKFYDLNERVDFSQL